MALLGQAFHVLLIWAWRLGQCVRRLTKPVKAGWSITAVHAFREHWDDDYAHVTAVFKPSPTWEAELMEYLGWDPHDPTFRAEVRYAYTNMFGTETKYRMVLRTDDPCPWPPCFDRSRTKPFSGILVAQLLPLPEVEEEAAAVDVTRRVAKYAGPNKDFHSHEGLALKTCDILPFDDLEWVTKRFGILRLLDERLNIRELDLRENPLLF